MNATLLVLRIWGLLTAWEMFHWIAVGLSILNLGSGNLKAMKYGPDRALQFLECYSSKMKELILKVVP